MVRKVNKREMRIWIDENEVVNWQGKDLKPSEVIMFGAVLTQEGLDMMGDTEHLEKPTKK